MNDNALYFDCSFGVAGDMTLGALIDLGADINYIISNLEKLPINAFELTTEHVVRRGISGLKLHIHVEEHDKHNHTHSHHHDHVHRKASSIFQMIKESQLPNRVKKRSEMIFHEIAVAEAKIHGISIDDVHFHEVGAMDSIIDIIGVCLALESLDISHIYAGPVSIGHGYINIEHGLYPVPAPATAEILKGVHLSDFTAKGELTTPTGAGIIKALANQLEAIPQSSINNIGYGAGTKDFEHPNILRVFYLTNVQDLKVSNKNSKQEEIVILETQIDDMPGEEMGFLMESLFNVGALDVYFTPVFMKKNRPGTLVTVLADPKLVEQCEETLFLESTTLGIRRSYWNRSVLERKIREIDTMFGATRIKEGFLKGKMIKQTPEFDDIAKAAKEHGIPYDEVYQVVMKQLSGTDTNT